jgi:hypothetical protein
MGLFGPSFMRVWDQGETAEGKIVGIRRDKINEDESTYEIEDYAIVVGGELVGVRQKLTPRDEVRLGMPVTVHRLGKAAVMRWGAPVDNRWKAVKPPALGIEDKVAGPPRGGWAPHEAEIIELGSRAGMLGLTTIAQATVRLSDGTEALVDKFVMPFYATHLGAVGTKLPVLRHPHDAAKIRVDWPAAAVANPGVGIPPRGGSDPTTSESGLSMGAGGGVSAPGFGKTGLFDRMQEKLVSATAGIYGADLNAVPPAEDPVSWDTFIAVSVAIRDEPATAADEVAQRHGVPPGEWSAANSRWMGRIMKDWKLGAAYGQALS